MSTVRQEYAASSNLVVTNLNSLNSSQGFLSGWSSGTIDNTTDKHLDKLISAKFTKAAANLQAGRIEVYAYAMLDDSNWPDIFSSGTEGAEGLATIHDDEQKIECLKLLWVTSTDAGSGEVHNMPPTSVASRFDNVLPAKFALFITGNCTTTTSPQFAAGGNQVTSKGVYNDIV